MKRILLFLIVASNVFASNHPAPTPASSEPRDFSKRIVFEKYLFAEGVDPHARKLDELMVKFFDEDMVRYKDGEFVSTNGLGDVTYINNFLSRHPEIKVELIIAEPEDEYQARTEDIERRSGRDLVDLFSFWRLRLPVQATDAKALLADVLKAPEIEIAYYQSIAVEATCTDFGLVTPNFQPNQDYHDPAPTGTDLTFANNLYTADVVNGGAGSWEGIFETWSIGANGIGVHLQHEDYANPLNRTPGIAPDTNFSHAAGVAGILGGCDANNVGVYGYLADQTIAFYDINNPPSVASVYNLANGELLAGEVTNSSWGWFTNPMPPGQSCSCNSGQNGMGPPEYDPPTKAAIDAGVAAGIIYVLSAGNGCTNLDAAVYGNTFRWSAETGSMYVGGVESPLPHDAICYTCFGERVTLNAWSENIYSTGGGSIWVGNGRREYYRWNFNGTSGAGPIVAGCAGAVNNIYRSVIGGNIDPVTLRGWLNDYGTEPGTTPGNIGFMPNLRGVVAPELNPDIRAGWSWYTVPRLTGDATGASCTLPADLSPAPSFTYWNYGWENESHIGTAPDADANLYRDDDWILVSDYGALAPQGQVFASNVHFASSDVRGGRHTIRLSVDPNNTVTEASETNNEDIRQYCWDPRQLNNGEILTLSAPPTKFVTNQTPSWPDENVDGYGGSNFAAAGWWDIEAVMTQSTTADYDAFAYSEDVTTTNGFDTYEAYSGYVGLVDFVGVNANSHPSGQAQPLIASVLNYDGETSDYRVECGTSSILSTPGTVGRLSAGSFSLDAAELFDVWEFNVNELRPYNIEVDVTSGNANVVISVFGPDDIFFARSSYNAQANVNGAGGDEMISCWTPTQTGWHSIVVHKNGYADWDQTATFDLYYGKAGFDLTSNLNAGWSNKIVVRQAVGATPALLPASLTGNAAVNYVNAGYINQGCENTIAGLNDQFYKDGPAVFTTGSWGGPYAPGGTTQWLNQNIGTVTGGRHQIGDYIDIFLEAAEYREDNNRHDEQFVWTPYSLTNNVMYTSPNSAPNWRVTDVTPFFSSYNQDGFRFTGGWWSGVGMVPNDATDDYDLWLYSPSTGSQNGFDTYLVPSWAPGAVTQWVVENGNVNGNGASYDAGIANNFAWPGDPSVSSYRVQQSNSMADLSPGYAYGPYPFPDTQVINCFDAYFDAGVPTDVHLDNLGTGDLGLAICAAGSNYASRTVNAAMQNSGGDGADEALIFTATATGWHGLVVFKNDRSDLPANAYRLSIGDRVPAAPESLVIKWSHNIPGSTVCELTWAPVTEDALGNPLTVDFYTLYYTTDLNAVYPAGWAGGGSTVDNTQVEIFLPDVWLTFECLVVAVDNDGFIVAQTPDLPGIQSFVGRPAEELRALSRSGQNLLIPASGHARE